MPRRKPSQLPTWRVTYVAARQIGSLSYLYRGSVELPAVGASDAIRFMTAAIWKCGDVALTVTAS